MIFYDRAELLPEPPFPAAAVKANAERVAKVMEMTINSQKRQNSSRKISTVPVSPLTSYFLPS
jgi:hypothetical protein